MKWKKIVASFLAALGLVVLANATILAKSGESLANDWKYFNALSLVVRSIILHYKTMPLHNPWVCGGLDILANPQNRIISPFLAADVLLAPQTANILSALLYGALGAIGMFQMLRILGAKNAGAILGSVIFINSTWFGLHFFSGHVPYGSMQLLPFSVIALLRISKPVVILATCVSHALLVLDGGIYTAVYSALLAATCVVLLPDCRKEAVLSLRHHPLTWACSLGVAALLSTPKIVPSLIALAGIAPKLDFATMTTRDVIQALFNPAMSVWDDFPEGTDLSTGFHEFGCYLTLTGLGAIMLAMIHDNKLRRELIPWLLGAAFWFWTASGWLPSINPWHLFHKIPLVNFLHVQSRTFILMHFFLIVAIVKAWQAISQRKTLAYGLFAILALEAILVRNLVGKAPLLKLEPIPGWRDLITSQTITTYVPFAYSTTDYLKNPNTSSSHCYEPSVETRFIRNREDKDYRGPAWVSPPEGGVVEVNAWTPGRISFSYKTTRAGSNIEFNSNALYGWTLEEGEGKIGGTGMELLTFTPRSPGEGKAVLVYRPRYLVPAFSLFACGVGIVCIMAWRMIHPRRRPHEEDLDRV